MPILPLLLALIALALFGRREAQFVTNLSGAEEVPPVPTDASGRAQFRLSGIGTSMEFRLTVADIENVTAAHIHQGAVGENGPIVVTLFVPPEPVTMRSRRTIAGGTFAAADLEGPLSGEPLLALVAEMLAGNTYVNVHTTQFPGGEIRGQIQPPLPEGSQVKDENRPESMRALSRLAPAARNP